MEKQVEVYCRFCAERKRSDKLFDLEKDSEKLEETNKKLHYLNAPAVDVSGKNMLPKTICFVCWDSLNKAYEFLFKLNEAQNILNDIFPRNSLMKLDGSDDDNSAFDDLYDMEPPRDDDDEPINKAECTATIKDEQKSHKNVTESITDLVTVKVEPKEEIPISTAEEPANCYALSTTENYDQSLNVQALLDAAMGDVPYTSNVTLYAKELSGVKKKSIIHWRDYTWACLHCNNEFSDVNMLRLHSKEVHKRCAAFMCIDCGETQKCYDFELFLAHVRKHKKSLRNLCHYCDIKTENLAEHLKTHFLKSDTACPACGEICHDEVHLLEHTRLYNLPKKKKTRRKRGTPVTIDDLTCKLCLKVYKNQNSLRDHRKLHNKDRKREYTCDRCGKTYFNKGTLTTHIMSHDKNRPHVCKICNKSFLFPNMLRRHVEMHSGIKPYSCEQCGRCFRLRYQLNAHKIVHTDSLPYVCQYCSKAFRFMQILKNHERQHTGAKPYSCGMCTMEFTNWSNYNKHMKRRHNTDTSKKKITPEGVFPINPETGQLIQIDDPIGTEKWKNEIMIPVKRGKKKKIKLEQTPNS